jgi:hypothetical protein
MWIDINARKLWGNRKERDFRDADVDGGIILKYILIKSVGKMTTGLIWLRLGATGWPL